MVTGNALRSFPSDQSGVLHACVTGLVDDDRFARLVHVVIHAKIGSDSMQQHAVIRGHLRELLILITENIDAKTS